MGFIQATRSMDICFDETQYENQLHQLHYLFGLHHHLQAQFSLFARGFTFKVLHTSLAVPLCHLRSALIALCIYSCCGRLLTLSSGTQRSISLVGHNLRRPQAFKPFAILPCLFWTEIVCPAGRNLSYFKPPFLFTSWADMKHSVSERIKNFIFESMCLFWFIFFFMLGWVAGGSNDPKFSAKNLAVEQTTFQPHNFYKISEDTCKMLLVVFHSNYWLYLFLNDFQQTTWSTACSQWTVREMCSWKSTGNRLYQDQLLTTSSMHR